MKQKVNYVKSEMLVLDVVQEYLDKNRYFDRNEIIPFISNRFSRSSVNINENGIKAILKSLVEQNIIVERSKLVREDILGNPNRKIIYSCIVENPGIHFNHLVKKLKLSIFTIEWHLNMLVKFKYIKKEEIGNQSAFYDLSIKDKDMELMYLLSSEKRHKLLEYLEKNDEGCTKNQLSKDLKMHFNTINKYLEEFEKHSLISKKKISRNYLYFLNEKLYDNLLEQKLIYQQKSIEPLQSILPKNKKKKAHDYEIHPISEIKGTRIAEDIAETEKELEIEMQEFHCIVHKAPIAGNDVYICPHCNTFYCQKCLTALQEKNEKCWSCNNDFA